jgi:translation initiation factor 2B subunit (eIF-2B alpha/beta/delta family)
MDDPTRGSDQSMKVVIDSVLREIREDRTTPAVELVRHGVDAITLFIAHFKGTPSDFFDHMVRISEVLITSQPSMAPFFHLANTLLLATEERDDLEAMKKASQEAIKDLVLHIQESVVRISKIARGLIPRRARILTHSYSSTVLRTLVDAKEEGKDFEVVCTESRPMCEGLELAKKLSENRIRVRLEIDCAAPYTMKDIDVVFVGADCITPYGLVAKVGTYGLAVGAKEKGIPFYALCGTEKLLGAGMAKKYRILRKDPREVWPDAPQGVEVFNFYFDATPLNYLTSILTEEGILRGNEILRRFQKMKVSDYFPT